MSGADTHNEYVGLLFRSHYSWLCSRLRRHLDSPASAEDIAAETFVQVLTSPGVVPIRQPRALLTTIAKRLIFQLWRRRDLEHAYLEVLRNECEESAPSPEELSQMLEALQIIDHLLDGLPSKVKATFLLSQVEGLTYAEIAVTLGISLRSVNDYMSKAFKRCLQASLE